MKEAVILIERFYNHLTTKARLTSPDVTCQRHQRDRPQSEDHLLGQHQLRDLLRSLTAPPAQ